MSKWNEPVRLVLDSAGAQTVHGPYAAAMLLMISWPTQEGAARERAERLCLGALDGRIDANDAREAFLVAMEEAGLALGSPSGSSLAA